MQTASRASWARGGGLLATLAVLVALIAPAGAQAAGTYPQYFCNSSYANPTILRCIRSAPPVASRSTATPAAPYPYTGSYFNIASMNEGGWSAAAGERAGWRALHESRDQPAHPVSERQPRRVGDRRSGLRLAQLEQLRRFVVVRRRHLQRHAAQQHEFQIGGSCNGSPGSCASGDWYFDYAVATLTDSLPPTVTTANSGLFSSARTAFRGSVAATADIVDTGKGPQDARVQIDGVDAVHDTLGDGTCNFRLATPCANRLGWTATVNTAAYADGVHTIRVRADDGLGNVTTVDRAVTFDNTAPVMGAVPAINGKTVTATSADLPVSANDATTGVAKLEASIDNGAWNTVANANTGAVTVIGAGSHTVKVRATDAAGNVSVEQPTSFTLQTVPTNQRLTTDGDVALPGAPAPGDTIKCDVGTPWTAGTTFTYQWLRDAALIAGATSQSYKLVDADADRTLHAGSPRPTRPAPRRSTGLTPRLATRPTSEATEAAPGSRPARPIRAATMTVTASPTKPTPTTTTTAFPTRRTPTPTTPTTAPTATATTPTAARKRRQRRRRRPDRDAERPRGDRDRRARRRVRGHQQAHDHRQVGRQARHHRHAHAAQPCADRRRQARRDRHPATDGRGYELARASRHRQQGPLQLQAARRRVAHHPLRLQERARGHQLRADDRRRRAGDPQGHHNVSKKSLRNKHAVTFKGKIAGAPAGVRKTVELQALDGRKWRTFATTRVAQKGGTFTYRYRFMRTTRLTAYKFRALVRAEKGWPFMTGTSSAKTVKVRP